MEHSGCLPKTTNLFSEDMAWFCFFNGNNTWKFYIWSVLRGTSGTTASRLIRPAGVQFWVAALENNQKPLAESWAKSHLASLSPVHWTVNQCPWRQNAHAWMARSLAPGNAITMDTNTSPCHYWVRNVIVNLKGDLTWSLLGEKCNCEPKRWPHLVITGWEM